MTHLVVSRRPVNTAQTMSEETGLPLPTVSKLLSSLARSGLVEALRGAKGGYRLARDPREISVAEIIVAVEGPIALTQCLEHGSDPCGVEDFCPSRRAWRIINNAVRGAIESVSLLDLVASPDDSLALTTGSSFTGAKPPITLS